MDSVRDSKQTILVDHTAAMLVCMVLMAVLAACSNSGSTTGHSDLPQPLKDARAMIAPFYPEAAKLPIVMENHSDLSRAMSYGSGRVYVATGLIDEVNAGVFAGRSITYTEGVQLLSCYLVHELWHKKGYGEPEAYAETAECLRTLGAPQYWIDRYQARA